MKIRVDISCKSYVSDLSKTNISGLILYRCNKFGLCWPFCGWYSSLLAISMVGAGLGGTVGCTSDWWSGDCGFDPCGSATFFHGERNLSSWNLFYGHSLPSANSKRTIVSPGKTLKRSCKLSPSKTIYMKGRKQKGRRHWSGIDTIT